MQATLRIPCLELAFNRSKGSLGPAEWVTWDARSYLAGPLERTEMAANERFRVELHPDPGADSPRAST